MISGVDSAYSAASPLSRISTALRYLPGGIPPLDELCSSYSRRLSHRAVGYLPEKVPQKAKIGRDVGNGDRSISSKAGGNE